MRPKPFVPEILEEDDSFVRDKTTGVVWHRVFHRPLYADTDRSQVVYHANYLRFFEISRASLMRTIGNPYKKVEEGGYVYPIVDLAITFHHPLQYDEPMWINCQPHQLEKVKVTFRYIITHAEEGMVVCKGHTTHCALGPSGRPTKVDPRTMKMWQEFKR